MEIEKLYGIHIGSIYEGGGLETTIFKKYEDARDRVTNVIIPELQEQDDRIYKDKDPNFDWVDPWTEVETDRWTNRIDEVVIVELEIK